ncbi:MAG: hypothetical protein Q7S84_02910 [bacterium]|nr:hypothetical protein [bacterium]
METQKQVSNGVDQQMQSTKRERKELKRQEKLEAKEATAQNRRVKKIASWGLGGGLTVVVIGGLIWYAMTRPPILESDVVSRSAFHWHPELTIYIKGERQEIPANIGIGAVHQPIHTHADDAGQGIIHLEFQGLARTRDVLLGQFFKNWGKDIRSFGTNMQPSDERGSTEGSRPNVTMTVNGEENAEYENYVMRDKDKIELRYE